MPRVCDRPCLFSSGHRRRWSASMRDCRIRQAIQATCGGCHSMSIYSYTNNIGNEDKRRMTYGEVVGSLPSQPAADTEADAAKLYARVTWRIVPILCAGFLIAYIDRANVGFAKLQMLGDLKFSESAYGMGAGLFFLGYILFEIPSNIALRRVGARAWIGRIMISWGILSGATMFVSTPAAFYALRFLLGVAE